MPILDRLNEERRRGRGPSRYDSKLRATIGRVERRIKFLLTNPLGALLRPRRTHAPLPLSEVSSILILRYDALGDAVQTTPVYRSIKRLAPHIRVGIAGSDRNRALFDHDPDIDEVFVFSRVPSFQLIRELFRARRMKWDIVLNLVYHDKTRGAIFAKIVAPQGISATSVRHNKKKYLRIYSVVGDRKPLTTPMAQQVLESLKEVLDLPIDITSQFPSLPDFPTIANAFEQEIQSVLHKSRKSQYIIINTDAAQRCREWGTENSLALAKRIVKTWPDYHVFLSSAPARAENIRIMLANEQKAITYLETPSILHLAIALRGATAVVSPDTSVVHFATAQRVPVVGLYLEPNEFLPYKTPSRVLFAPDGKFASGIKLGDVFQSLNDLLAETNATR
jgi:ADP-heptose:LPS heptosyltransferase